MHAAIVENPYPWRTVSDYSLQVGKGSVETPAAKAPARWSSENRRACHPKVLREAAKIALIWAAIVHATRGWSANANSSYPGERAESDNGEVFKPRGPARGIRRPRVGARHPRLQR
jgi:hypothetical protein